MPPVPIDEPLGYRRGRRVSYNEAVGTAPIPHGHAIVNSPPPNHHRNPKTKACVTAVRTHRRPSSWRAAFDPAAWSWRTTATVSSGSGRVDICRPDPSALVDDVASRHRQPKVGLVVKLVERVAERRVEL